MSLSINNLKKENPNHTFRKAPKDLNHKSFSILIDLSMGPAHSYVFIIDFRELINSDFKRLLMTFFKFKAESKGVQQSDPYCNGFEPIGIVFYKDDTLHIFEDNEEEINKNIKMFINNCDIGHLETCTICYVNNEFQLCYNCCKPMCIECIQKIECIEKINPENESFTCPFCRNLFFNLSKWNKI